MSGRRAARWGVIMIEHASLIAILAATLIGMAVYLTRALCGKWRDVSDSIGDGRQYERGVTLIDGELR